uniref:Uncharacterized protein n=1 Tax=Arundo donax TaxID=35708 RepID=A0A0A9EE95_ARUDO
MFLVLLPRRTAIAVSNMPNACTTSGLIKGLFSTCCTGSTG